METGGRLEPYAIRVHSFPLPTMDVLIFTALLERGIYGISIIYIILFEAVACVSVCAM